MLKLDLVKQIEAVDPSTVNTNFGVMDMAHDLGKVMRGIKAAPRDHTSMWIYRPQDTYPMGYIVYADLMDGGDGAERYSVFSPNISNGKYTHGEREFMASTLHRAKAVKNAAKYLRPLSPIHVLQQVHGAFIDKKYTAMALNEREHSSRMSKVSTNLFKPGLDVPLMAELKRILQSGYEFADKELEADFREALQAKEEKQIDRTEQIGAQFSFVEIVQQAGQTMFRGYGAAPTYRQMPLVTGTDFSYTQEELPEHLRGAIAVLSMLGAGEYVNGVGYRAADNMFYVKCV